MLQEREIKEKWVEDTLNNPDEKAEKDDETIHYIKSIKEYKNRYLRIIINPDCSPQRIVTIFFDRRLRRQKQ